MALEHVFSQAISIEIADGIACALLAGAASARSRGFGAGVAGCIALGCICGVAGPLLRELILHGQTGAKMVVAALPGEAFMGAAGSIAALYISKAANLFFWLDSGGLNLTACLAAALGAPEIGAGGALALGLASSLLPGMIRDVAMGDAAMFLDKPWYAASPAIGACVTMLIILLPAFGPMPSFFVARTGEWAILGGTIAGMAILYWKNKI